MIQRFSLTARLTFFYTLTSAIVLLGLGWITSVAMNQHFENIDRATLQDKIHLIQEVGGKGTTMADLRESLNDILHGHDGLVVSIQRNGIPIFATSELKIPNELTRNVGSDPQAQDLLIWQNAGHQYRALGAVIASPSVGAEAMTVWVALDTKHHAYFQQRFQFVLTVYVILATLLSGVLGWIAANRGMTPLRIMQSRAQAVTSNKMGERMPVDAVPVEMADLANTLNDMLDRLQGDFRRLSEFSSDLAHELRTPISNLLTETQVTLSMSRTNADYQDVLASNSEELQRLARMVSDMLFLAKAEHGLALPRKETLSAAKEVQAINDFYEALAEEKQLGLELRGEGTILGDRLMVRRAFSNLLSNALRYATPHSVVSIQIQSVSDVTTVSVINQGVTIGPEVLPRLFDRFFRADKSRAHQDSDGAGLGLAITRAIMERHSGSIAATSQSGVTCFTLTFPNADAA